MDPAFQRDEGKGLEVDAGPNARTPTTVTPPQLQTGLRRVCIALLSTTVCIAWDERG